MHGGYRLDQTGKQGHVISRTYRKRDVKSGGADARVVCSRHTEKKILIPLTSSLYVPGRIKDTENVLVDVGTGYFVDKVLPQ
jgi:hypothetical protein